jgi:hypothetical protein
VFTNLTRKKQIIKWDVFNGSFRKPCEKVGNGRIEFWCRRVPCQGDGQVDITINRGVGIERFGSRRLHNEFWEKAENFAISLEWEILWRKPLREQQRS